VGVDLDAWWSMTPREWGAVVQGRLWRRRQDDRRARVLAYQTAALVRAETLPGPDRFLADRPVRRRLSREEQAELRARHAWLQESMHRHFAGRR
jgi:hypothetical protein